MSTVRQTLENFSKVQLGIEAVQKELRAASLAFDGKVLHSETLPNKGYAQQDHGSDLLGQIANRQDDLASELMVLARDVQDLFFRISGTTQTTWNQSPADKVADDALRTALQTMPEHEKEVF